MRDFTDITIILDRSGSMQQIIDGTIEGVNAFINEQKAVPGDGCWSLVLFDDQYEPVYTAAPQNEVPLLNKLNYVTRGSTALVDAVCQTIDKTGDRLRALPEDQRPSRVLMVVMTDGLENSSKKFNRINLSERVARQRDEYNWKFVFLGANQDAICEAAKYGIHANSSKTYAFSDQGSASVLTACSAGTRAWKADGNDTAQQFIPPGAGEPDKVVVDVSVTKGKK